MWRRVDIVLTGVSEERIVSIFRVKKEKKIRKRRTGVSICTCSHRFFACGFSSFFFYPEDGGDTFSETSVNTISTYTASHPTSQKISVFIVTAVKTPNLTQ
jgi:hypothetical protein